MTKHIPLILITALFISACSGGNGGGKYEDYQEPEEEIIESPYADGSGHDAGFQWAEENGIDDPAECGGNSVSFIEGCEEYANTVSPESDPSEEMPWEDGR